MSLYRVENLNFTYPLGTEKVHALRDLSLEIKEACFLALTGPSGSGKTTLLNVLGLIEPPQAGPESGNVWFGSHNFRTITEKDKCKIRRYEIGFIFQTFHLFPILRADENVEFFLNRQGLPKGERKARTKEALEAVGLWEHRSKRPLEMSGGQRQRVAIARAIAKKPRVFIADEPTASLDQNTGREIMDILKHLNEKQGVSIIVSSHDPMVRTFCSSEIRLIDGRALPEVQPC